MGDPTAFPYRKHTKFMEGLKKPFSSHPPAGLILSYHSNLPSIFRDFWNDWNSVHLFWILGSIFPSSLLTALTASPRPSHAAAPTLPQSPLLPHAKLLHPCGLCPFMWWPPLSFCKTRKLGSGHPLCTRQAPVHTIPRHLRASGWKAQFWWIRLCRAAVLPVVPRVPALPGSASHSPPRSLTFFPCQEKSSVLSEKTNRLVALRTSSLLPGRDKFARAHLCICTAVFWWLMSDCHLLSIWAARGSQESGSSPQLDLNKTILKAQGRDTFVHEERR